MPCVYLSNTFRQWQTFKALNVEKRNQRRSARQTEHDQRRLAKQTEYDQRRLAKQAARDERRLAKQAKRAERLAKKQQKQLSQQIQAAPTTPAVAQPTIRADFAREGEIWRVPHQRQPLFQKSATVSQTLTAAISTQLHEATAPSLPLIQPINLQPGASRSDLINAESRLGSTIFGPIPAGHRREFFHDRENIWIWHEDWQDQTQNSHQFTVRYEVRTSGVYKKISAGRYSRLDGNELENFRRATKAYLYLVKKYLYGSSFKHNNLAYTSS